MRDYEAARQAFWTRFHSGYYLDESYLSPSSKNDFQGAVARFEGRTGRKLDYIMLTDLKTSPGKTLRRLLPTVSARYELAGDSEPIVAIYRLKKQDAHR